MQNFLNILLALGVLGLLGWIIISPSRQQTAPPINNNQSIESPTPMPSPKMQFTQAEQVIKTGKKYQATLTTSLGDITLELSTTTPKTTNNFIFLAQKGFYDGVIFHRVIPGFMIQGGDPTGTGSGGPGYRFDDESFTGEYTRGTIAMANAGPNTNGSQFFIMHADYPLPPNYVIFGKVTKGIEVVDQIANLKTVVGGRENSRPVTPPTITKIAIVEQ